MTAEGRGRDRMTRKGHGVRWWAAVYLDAVVVMKLYVSVKLTESERLSCTVYNTPQLKKKIKKTFFKN